MNCLDAAAIARTVTLGADDEHVRDCVACRRRIEADLATRRALRALPVPALPRARRAELAAEIIAAAQFTTPPQRRRRRTLFATTAGALAAAIALVVAWPSRAEVGAPPSLRPNATEPVAVRTTSTASEDAPPALAAPRIVARDGAIVRHVIGAQHDVVTLVDGTIQLDTTIGRDVDLRVGDSVIRVQNATVVVHATKRAITSVRVIVGTARIEGGDQRVVLERGSLWLPAPPAKQRSLEAFRAAWVELRAGRHRQAIELFDSVTDPVAREEAAYWAAIAARRSGDLDGARERFAKFLREFPKSDYAAALATDPR